MRSSARCPAGATYSSQAHPRVLLGRCKRVGKDRIVRARRSPLSQPGRGQVVVHVYVEIGVSAGLALLVSIGARHFGVGADVATPAKPPAPGIAVLAFTDASQDAEGTALRRAIAGDLVLSLHGAPSFVHLEPVELPVQRSRDTARRNRPTPAQPLHGGRQRAAGGRYPVVRRFRCWTAGEVSSCGRLRRWWTGSPSRRQSAIW